MRLADKRARIVDPSITSIFEGKFFPSRLEGQPATIFLALQTRHTPRDFLALLKHVQEFASEPGLLNRDAILSGLRQYSQVYFRDELDDALDSYFNGRVKAKVLAGHW